MADALDFFAQKTPAELRFFGDNPTFYAPDLVAGAGRELRRRGLLPTPDQTAEVPARRGRWQLALLAGVGLLAADGCGQSPRPGPPAPAPAAVKKAPPKLETVETNALPNFEGAVTASVARQLAAVPAAEKARLDVQTLRQYDALSRRFWAAETMSEYLLDQARQHKPNAVLAEQTVLAREAWTQWNHAAVYSFHFGPVMADHLKRMGSAASIQQYVMADLPGFVAAGQVLATPAQRQRNEELQDILSGLLPVSPVTGRPYQRITRRIEVKL